MAHILITRDDAGLLLGRDISRLRNYEIEEYLPEYIVGEPCPFNGRFSSYGSDLVGSWDVQTETGESLGIYEGTARSVCTNASRQRGIHERWLYAVLVSEPRIMERPTDDTTD